MSLEQAASQLTALMVEREVVAQSDVDERLHGESKVPTPVQLVSEGIVSQADVLRVIAERINVGFFDPATGQRPEAAALVQLDKEVAKAESALPIRVDAGRLIIATDDPLDREKRERLAAASRSEIVLSLAPREPLLRMISQTYQAGDHESEPGAEVTSLLPKSVGFAEEAGYHINELLEVLLDAGGSDLHLTAGSPPQIRVNGELRPMEGYDKLLPGALQTLIYSILTGRQREELEENLELDASHPVPGKGRFRLNAFFQRGALGVVMRAIPNRIQTLEELGMPPVVREFADLPRGLVLVTGATGSGKSTTLAAMIDVINSSRSVHIMTVEDPIEFMHHHKQAIVNQREVGQDTRSFASALRHALRQDPDVIQVGEMRDLETIGTALTAAETGHLVFATLHTQDAPGSVERILDVFPPHHQQQIRVQLAETLQGVVTQSLLPTVDGNARVPAVEVLVGVPAIKNLIREGKVHQIRSAMQAGGRHGMQTLDHSLAGLIKSGKVDFKVASEQAQNIDEFMNLVGGMAPK